MPKNIIIQTEYDESTRRLTSTAQATGFVPELPDKVIMGTEIQTVTMAANDTLSDSDYKCLQVNMVKAINTMNLQLQGYLAAGVNLAEAKEIIDAEAAQT